MGIKLTEEEKKLVEEGKLDPSNIEEHRKIFPIRVIDHNKLDVIKEQIKETNLKYRESIQKNKDLYMELETNRKEKEEWRNKLAKLRLEKKKIMGLIE